MEENKINYLISEVLDWKNEWNEKMTDKDFMHRFARSQVGTTPDDSPELGLKFINRMHEKYNVQFK